MVQGNALCSEPSTLPPNNSALYSSASTPTRFLNPKTDFAFKRIFGSTESGDILISFLNAALELEAPYRIEAVEILAPYLAPVSVPPPLPLDGEGLGRGG